VNQETEQEQTKRKQRAENGRGKGTRVYVGTELLEVLENFQDMSDYSTMRKTSDELAKLLKKHNLFLRDAAEHRGKRKNEEQEESDDGFAGFTGI